MRRIEIIILPKVHKLRDGVARRNVVVLLQTHRDYNFGSNGQIYDNPFIELRSSSMPENGGHCIFLRGRDRTKDYHSIYLRETQLEKLIEAIKLYNEDYK